MKLHSETSKSGFEFPKIVGVILAGGQSKRMGQDKALLTFKGSSLLQRTWNTLKSKESLLHTILVSGRQGAFPFIEDKFPKCGPLSGIYSVMTALRETNEKIAALVFIPIDMPLLTSKVIRQLIQTGMTQSEFDVVHYTGQNFPLFVRNDARVMCSLENFFSRSTGCVGTRISSFSLKHWMCSLAPCQVTPDESDLSVFTNVNTPEEWEQFTKK